MIEIVSVLTLIFAITHLFMRSMSKLSHKKSKRYYTSEKMDRVANYLALAFATQYLTYMGLGVIAWMLIK